MSRGTCSKNWLTTVFDMDFRETLISWGPEGLNPICNYLIFGEELCPTTLRPHFQCYFVFKQSKRLSALRKLLPTCKWIPADGTAEDNKAYCSKESHLPHGRVVELGDISTICGWSHSGGVNSGRADLAHFKAAVQAGCINLRELRELHTAVFAKYPRFVREYIQDYQPAHPLPVHDFNAWQQELQALLVLDPCDRKVIFVVDRKGNSGKTWFAKYYLQLNPTDTQVLKFAKHADMAYALETHIRVLFLNCSRQQVEYMNFDFLESVKDGMVFSTKYESVVKTLDKVHVVVLMNEMPDMSKLSDDRYHIIKIK